MAQWLHIGDSICNGTGGVLTPYGELLSHLVDGRTGFDSGGWASIIGGGYTWQGIGCTILLGANDANRDRSVAQYESDMTTICNDALGFYGLGKVIVLTPTRTIGAFQSGGDPAMVQRVLEYRTSLLNGSMPAGVRVWDAWPVLQYPSDMDDEVHPSQSGHHRLRQYLDVSLWKQGRA